MSLVRRPRTAGENPKTFDVELEPLSTYAGK